MKRTASYPAASPAHHENGQEACGRTSETTLCKDRATALKALRSHGAQDSDFATKVDAGFADLEAVRLTDHETVAAAIPSDISVPFLTRPPRETPGT